MKKWNCGVFTTKIDLITNDELEEYVIIKMYEYSDGRLTDSNLWKLFKSEFKNFTVEHFDRVLYRELCELRIVLRRCGIRVQQDNGNHSIVQSLMAIFGKIEQVA